jgi:hypothetical protein
MGELLDIKLAGRDLKRIRVAVDSKMLSALKSHPIVRDDSSKGLFESCGIVPGAVATLYHADYPTWSALVARIDRLSGRGHR